MGVVYFDPDVDSPVPSPKHDYLMTSYELSELLREVVDASEKITEVKYYSHSRHRLLLSKCFTSHAFIVLKTDNCWWSMEKDQRGITVQRSKYLENVRDKYRRYDRIAGTTNGIEMLKKASGNFTVNELVLLCLPLNDPMRIDVIQGCI
uniref:Uncharacterized protein n=1 Tax=Daphnia galeata TaxID=27404 RepID=A0A8J2WLH3_9CRUS|nr:unnamed protein product [Daphnia galeata]